MGNKVLKGTQVTPIQSPKNDLDVGPQTTEAAPKCALLTEENLQKAQLQQSDRDIARPMTITGPGRRASSSDMSPFAIATGVSHARDAAKAVTEALDSIHSRLPTVSFMVVYTTFDYDCVAVADAVALSAPNVPWMGGTQSTGLFTNSGWIAQEDGKCTLGIFAICDPQGWYGVGHAQLYTKGGGIGGVESKSLSRQAGASAMLDAIRQTPKGVGKPNAIWLMTEMDSEEGVLQGIGDVMAASSYRPCAIGGGSSGNSDGSEPGRQFANGKAYRNSVVIALFHSTAIITGDFGNGFQQTELSGMVTKAHGRIIEEIDGQPAADVYNKWNGGIFSSAKAGEAILSRVTMIPLGRVKLFSENGEPQFVLLTPLEITADRGLHVLAEVQSGERIYQMRGRADSIVGDLKVMTQKLVLRAKSHQEIHGVLMTWCVCFLQIKDQFPAIAKDLSTIFKGKPFLGANTFGEQGTFCGIEGLYAQGNDMVSSLMFYGKRGLLDNNVSTQPAPPIGDVALIILDCPQSPAIYKRNPDVLRQTRLIIRRFIENRLSSVRGRIVSETAAVQEDPEKLRIFAVAPTALDAIHFVQTAQNLFMNLPWPEDLLEMAECREIYLHGNLLYRGPRCRLAVHFGRPQFAYVPSQSDLVYSGAVVDELRAIHEATQLGTTTVSQRVIDEAARSVSSFYEYEVPLDKALKNLTLGSPRVVMAAPPGIKLVEVICTHLQDRLRINFKQ